MKSRQDIVVDLLNERGRSLHRLLARLTRCEHTTSDLMQELFIRLSQSDAAARASDLYAYAWKTATNLAFEWRRRQRIALSLQGEHEPPDESELPAVKRLIEDEQIERLLEATSRLDDLARSVVLMRFVEQDSYERIAQRLGKNQAYLRSLCSKSLARLRSILSEQDSACGSESHHD